MRRSTGAEAMAFPTLPTLPRYGEAAVHSCHEFLNVKQTGGCAFVSFGELDGVRCAWKRLRTDLSPADTHTKATEMRTEIDVLSRMPFHPNVVRLSGIVCDQDGAESGFLMQIVDFSLHEYIKSEGSILHGSNVQRKAYVEEFTAFVVDIVCAFMHIHTHGWLHNDMHPKNVGVVLSQHSARAKAVMLDFGKGCRASPILRKKKQNRVWLCNDSHLTAASDAYSLGTMMMQGVFHINITVDDLLSLSNDALAFGIPIPTYNMKHFLTPPWLSLIKDCLGPMYERPTMSIILARLRQIQVEWQECRHKYA